MEENQSKTAVSVLVADDSVLMRLLIKDILQEDPEIQVIGYANNGREAALLTKQLRPNVVLMDMTMGEYDGLYGVQKIMADCPTPILILSALGNTNMDPILDGLKMGAVDYLNKPAQNSVNMRQMSAVLIEKIKEVSKVVLKEVPKEQNHINIHEHSFDDHANYDIIVIGASTGGPTAIETVLTQLPKNLNVPVLVVQHIPPNFVPAFAARLNQITPLSVRMAQKGDILEAGNILIAPGDKNMIVRRKEKQVFIDFTDRKFIAYNDPSVDSLMLSVAEVYGKKGIGVLLTGMGKDGALGMKAIKEKGGYTIAQSQKTCVVYGMPRAAVETDAVVKVVNLDEIGGFLVSCLA